jgi:hypothetical protein
MVDRLTVVRTSARVSPTCPLSWHTKYRECVPDDVCYSCKSVSPFWQMTKRTHKSLDRPDSGQEKPECENQH